MNSLKHHNLLDFLVRQDTDTLESIGFFIWSVLMDREANKNPPDEVAQPPKEEQHNKPVH